MVLGRCGSMMSVPFLTAFEIGRAAGGLGAEEADRLVFDEAERDQFVEGFADFGNQRAAGHGNDDVVGQAPAELLGDFKADGLRSFGVVGAQIYVDEAPVVAIGDLRAEAIDVVVVAIDAHQRRAVDLGVENLGRLEIGGDKDEGLEAETRGVRSNGVGKVAGGRAADRIESEGLRIGQCDRDDAIFEAERGHADGVVLDVEIARADAGIRGAAP